MLYFIDLFPKTDYGYKSDCEKIVSECVNLIKYLDCDELNTQLIGRLVNILVQIQQHGQLDELATQAGHQVRSLQVGPEARCLVRCMSLTSRLARHSMQLHTSSSLKNSLSKLFSIQDMPN